MLCLFLQMEWEQERRSVSISLVRPYKDVNTEAYFQARFMSSHGEYHLNSHSCYVRLLTYITFSHSQLSTSFTMLMEQHLRDWLGTGLSIRTIHFLGADDRS